MAVMHENRIDEGALAPARLAPWSWRRPGWWLAMGVLMTGGILALAFFNRAWLLEAIGLVRTAQPAWCWTIRYHDGGVLCVFGPGRVAGCAGDGGRRTRGRSARGT